MADYAIAKSALQIPSDLPDGRALENPVKSRPQKIFPFFRTANQCYGLPRSATFTRGVRVVTNVVRNAVDVRMLTDERRSFTDGEVVWSWRPEVWRQVRDDAQRITRATVANGMVHRGEHV
jgi:hypothetical protein